MKLFHILSANTSKALNIKLAVMCRHLSYEYLGYWGQRIYYPVFPSFELPAPLRPFVLKFPLASCINWVNCRKSRLAYVLIMKTQHSVAAFLTHTL